MDILGRETTRHWDLGPRRLPYHMLHYVVSGGHQGTVDGKPVETHPGCLLWLPPGAHQHLVQRGDARSFIKLYFRFTLEGAEKPAGAPLVCPNAHASYPWFVELYAEFNARLPGREQRLRALLVLLFNQWERALERPQIAFGESERVRLLDLVDRDPLRRPTPAELASAFGMSPTWFSRVFKTTFGYPPRTWLMRHRIQKSAERLADAVSVSAVAAELGYEDLFLFSRQFRAVMGKSPSEYKQLVRGFTPERRDAVLTRDR
jgi:AraC-like DNA-binding protein